MAKTEENERTGNLGFVVPVSLIKRMKLWCLNHEQTQTQVMTLALEEFLDRHEPKKPK